MGYAILRTKKLKTMAAVVGSAKHTFRQIPTPNADPAATGRNRTVGAKSAEAVTAAVSRLLPEKRRKDAVLCIEYLITASPEDFKRHGGGWTTSGAEEGRSGLLHASAGLAESQARRGKRRLKHDPPGRNDPTPCRVCRAKDKGRAAVGARLPGRVGEAQGDARQLPQGLWRALGARQGRKGREGQA